MSSFFAHMADEEKAYNEALQGAYSDQELAGIEGALVASIPPEKMAKFSSLMLPAMNLPERVALLDGARRHAPAPAFAGLCRLAEQVLDPVALRSLERQLYDTMSA